MNQSEIREQNIRKVLDTAQMLFLRDGIQNTSINSIAEHCGLSPMSIYRYFKNKDNLAAQVWHDSLIWFYDQQFMPAYLKVARDLTCGYDRLRACLDVYISIYSEHPEFLIYSREMLYTSTRLQEASKDDPENDFWSNHFREIPAPVLRALTEGVEDGSIRPDVNVYEVYQMVTNIYTGPTILDSATVKVNAVDIFRYTAELLEENLKNKSYHYKDENILEKNA